MINQTTKTKITHLTQKYHHLTAQNPSSLPHLTLSELPEMVYNSNAIENSTLTLEDTEDILIRHQIRTDHEIREIHEAENLAQAIRHLLSHPPATISTDLILHLHGILLANIRPDIAGHFRSGHQWVRVGTHIGANPAFVPALMHELVNNYNAHDDIYFLEKIAHFHAEFENIHPFLDGNGRIGRLLTNTQLSLLNLPPIIIPNKSKFQDYYPALDEYSKYNKTDQITTLFANLLTEALHRHIAKLAAIKIIPLADWTKLHHLGLQSSANKAARGTIPAFRIRGRWMIDANFQQSINSDNETQDTAP